MPVGKSLCNAVRRRTGRPLAPKRSTLARNRTATAPSSHTLPSVPSEWDTTLADQLCTCLQTRAGRAKRQLDAGARCCERGPRGRRQSVCAVGPLLVTRVTYALPPRWTPAGLRLPRWSAARGRNESRPGPSWPGVRSSTWATCLGRRAPAWRALRGAKTAWPPRRTGRTPPTRPPARSSLPSPWCRCTRAIPRIWGANRWRCSGPSK